MSVLRMVGAEILILVLGTQISEPSLYLFLSLSLVLPALCALVYGWKESQRKKVEFLPVTLLFSLCACVYMYFMYHTGAIQTIVENTRAIDGFVLDFNTSMNIGTVIELEVIVFVCAILGGILKGSGAKIQN